MTVDEIHALASRVHGLLPGTRVPDEPLEAELQHSRTDLIAEELQRAGFAAIPAMVLATALCGFLGGWAGRYGNLDDAVLDAQEQLNAFAGGAQDGPILQPPEGDIGVAPVAMLLDWWLSREDTAADEEDAP